MTKIFDATTENFEQIVIHGSTGAYVLVDFWATWCNPCQVLKPMLEAMTAEYDYTLVKVNTEQEQALAAQLGVRSIPDVRLYKDGAEVDRFAGALSEAQLRAFLEKYMPSRLDAEIERAVALAQAGEQGEATALFNKLLDENPGSGKVKLAAARFLHALGMNDDADRVLETITPDNPEYDTARAMLAMDELRAACAGKDNAEGLDRSYADAACAALAQDYAAALEGFLGIIKQDKSYHDGAARKAMVMIFDALGRGNPLVQQYQRALATALH